jgi:hypothetical protein
MGYMKSIKGTFTNANIVDGILTLTYATDVDTPLHCVIFNSLITSETQTYTVEKVSVNECDVNVGEQYQTGTWRYRLLYVNN